MDAAPGSDQQQRVDDLRQQLRALGYLDAGVDRFLLAPARTSGNPVGVALKSAVRVGVLAGVMLGPAAAIGMAARIPGLISSPRDALVLAVYFAALFLVLFAAAAAVLGTLALLIVRTRRTTGDARLISGSAGLVVGVACLAYLTLWWRTANAGLGWHSPVLTAFALFLAVAISLTLGHAMRITTLGVLATATTDALPAPRRRSWRLVTASAALAFIGASALLVATTSAEPAADIPPRLTVISSGMRVRVIAIDGVDPQLFDLDQWLGGIREQVGWRYRLGPEDTSDPARIWTTIATGEPPFVHGVRAIETRRVAGLQGILSFDGHGIGRALQGATDLVRLTRPSVASRDERQSMTFWEVAEQAGLRTAVVNWWATWPALAANGVIVTDRAVLRLEHGGAQDAEIAPPELYPALADQWSAIRKVAAKQASAAFKEITDRAVVDALRRSATLDATMVGLANAIPGPPRDLDVVYLPGLDIVQHTILGARDGAPIAPSAVNARVSALRAYEQFLRSLLGSWLNPAAGEIAMLVTQPGRVAGNAAGTITIAGAPGTDVEPPVIGSAAVVDIAPTVLHLLGVPLSRELVGHPLLMPFPSRFPPPVSSYGRPFRSAAPRSGKPLDQEMIDRLRSLGYVR